MREIIFRGKRTDNGEWVEGNLFIPDLASAETEICIGTPRVRMCFAINPETVGQFTGLTDKNGKRIFEGDIIKNEYEKGKYQYFRIFFSNYSWGFANKYGMTGKLYNALGYLEVIGNIYDNPELLNDEREGRE